MKTIALNVILEDERETRARRIVEARIARNRPKTFALAPIAPPSFTSTTEEKTFFVPTGEFRTVKKTGETKENLMKVTLYLATVTVTHGANAFTLRASSRATSVLDSRDGKRKTMAEIRAEIVRLFGNDSPMADLEIVALAKPHPPKVKVRKMGAPFEFPKEAPVVRFKNPKEEPPNVVGLTPGKFHALMRRLSKEGPPEMQWLSLPARLLGN